MLDLEGWERILDLACATGRRNEPTRRLDGVKRTLMEFDPPQYCKPEPFQRRLYTIEELAEIFADVGLRLADVFDERGRPCAPSDAEQELYVEARC